MGFVEQPGFAFESRFAGIANFHARPGVELDNPDSSINGGAISVLTGWNLGSGKSADALDFRYNGNAPVLTLRAANNVAIDASISDGFYQESNPFSGGGPQATLSQANADYHTHFKFFEDNFGVDINSLVSQPSKLPGADPAEAKQYYGQYVQLLNLLFNKPEPALGSVPGTPITLVSGFLFLYAPEEASTIQFFPGEPTAPAAPTSPAAWSGYLTSYESYAS